MDAERGAHRERLHHLLEDRRWRAAARRSCPPAASGPAPPSASRTEKPAARPRAEVGDVGADEGDDGDRPDQRHAEDQRADRDDHGVEGGDDRDAEEVAAQRAEHRARWSIRATGFGSPRWPSAQARICGPSLSRKNRLSAVSARKNTSEESLLDARRGRRRCSAEKPSLSAAATRSAWRRRPSSRSTPMSLEPAADRVLGGVELAGDRRRPRR